MVPVLFVKPNRSVVQSVKAMVGEPAGRLVSDVGISHGARPIDLRIADAVALFRPMRAYWSETD
jgi:hypothetical protein